jgi:hypothetical protein
VEGGGLDGIEEGVGGEGDGPEKTVSRNMGKGLCATPCPIA